MVGWRLISSVHPDENPATTNDVLKLFEGLNADGLTLVIVTHENEVAERARRRVAFRDGRIVSDERTAR